MTKKILDIAVFSVGAFFLCWYLPVAFHNVYACDDYWFGSNVRRNGFWGNQMFYYINWEGSYTHTFLASFPHVFHGLYIPFFCNMFSLILLFLSLLFFLKTFTNLPAKRGLGCILYLLSFLYLYTKGDSEIRFWICANISYIPEMSFFLIFFALYHNLEKVSSYKRWLLVFLCIFFLGGSKLTFITYTFGGLIIHDILYERVVSRHTLVVYSFLVLFVILNVVAPGNYIRLEEERISKDIGAHMGLAQSVFYRITEMKSFMLNTLFLLPIAARWTSGYSFKKKRVFAALAVFGIAFVLDSMVLYICFHDSGPLRVYFVTEVISALLVLFILNHFYTTVLCKYYYTRHVMVLFAFFVAVSHMSLFFQVPKSVEFSEKARERDAYVMSCPSGKTIEIAPLPSSYLMLSYFSNDVMWLKGVYLPYFQKKNKFVLLQSLNSSEK